MNRLRNPLALEQPTNQQPQITNHQPQDLGNTFIRAYYGGEGIGAGSLSGYAPALKRGQLFMISGGQSSPGFKEDLIRAIELGAVLLLENLVEDMDDLIEQVGEERGSVYLVEIYIQFAQRLVPLRLAVVLLEMQ